MIAVNSVVNTCYVTCLFYAGLVVFILAWLLVFILAWLHVFILAWLHVFILAWLHVFILAWLHVFILAWLHVFILAWLHVSDWAPLGHSAVRGGLVALPQPHHGHPALRRPPCLRGLRRRRSRLPSRHWTGRQQVRSCLCVWQTGLSVCLSRLCISLLASTAARTEIRRSDFCLPKRFITFVFPDSLVA